MENESENQRPSPRGDPPQAPSYRSEEQYRLLFDNNPQPMWVYESGTHAFLAVNEAATRHYGYSREEFLRMTIRDIRPAEDTPALIEASGRSPRGLNHSGIWRHRKKDGTIILVHITSHSITFDGKPARLVLAADITERQRAEEELRQRQQQYETLVNSVDGIVWEADAQTFIFTFVSKQAERMLGYPVERWLSEPGFWKDHIFPEDRDWALSFCLEAVSEARPHQFEYRMVAADGRVVWLSDIVTVEAENNRPVKLRGIMVDITARKQAEEALRRAERQAITEYEKLLERLASLAQSFGTARGLLNIYRALGDFAVASTPCNSILISLYDQERRERTAVYAWSEGEEASPASLPPMPLADGPHGRAVATGEIVVTDDFERAVEGQPVRLGFGRRESAPRSSLVVPMAVMGRTLGAIEVQSPEPSAFRAGHVTAMRMAANLAAVAIENVRLFERERVRAGLEAETEKMRSLGQLAAGVAHDFNNSLAAILGRAQLLLRTATDEKQRQSLEIIETAALDAGETVRRIQTFARREPDARLRAVSISKLIKDAIQLTRTRWETDAQARGVGYDIQFDPAFDGGDEVSANSSELREVFVNLILNSLDAMPSGGRIDLRESKRGGSIVVEVCDTGEGMPREIRDRIFEPFFTTKGPQGSGLGLAVTHSIVHRHAGAIEVESEVGRGTTFRLFFPQTHAAAPPPAREQRPDLPTRRVLVVDDEEMVRTVIAEMLRELKQEVVEAAGGPEALDALGAAPFDLMITDLSMPAMDGLSLAAEARKLAPEMMIVLATGYGQSIPGDPPDLTPINLIVNKPFQMAELEAALWMISTTGRLADAAHFD